MNSQVTADFLECFAQLPEAVRKLARKNYRLWRGNSAHPGLQFKKIHGHENIYSVRIGQGWRALGLLENDTIKKNKGDADRFIMHYPA